jgi:hypothetical protein
MELLAKPIDQSTEVDTQLLVQTAVLAQLDDERLIDLENSQPFAVGTKRIGEHIGIALVVFGSRRAVTIPEAVKLFRIDPEDSEAALQQTLDKRTPAQFDSDGYLLWVGAQLKQAAGKHVHASGTMFDRELGLSRSRGLENTDLMRVVGPVNTSEQSIARFHICSPLDSGIRPPSCCIAPVLALAAQLPTGCAPWLPRRDARPPLALAALGPRMAFPASGRLSHHK